MGEGGKRSTGIGVIAFIVVVVTLVRTGLLAHEVPVLDFFEVHHCFLFVFSVVVSLRFQNRTGSAER